MANKITFTLNEVVNSINSHADAILREQFEMTFSQFIFLLSLRDGKKSLTEAAKQQGVSVAAVSKRISWFEDRELINCTNDPHHGRKSVLVLTSKGKNLVDKSSIVLEEKFQELFKGMKDLNLPDMNKKLNLIHDHLQEFPIQKN